MTLEDARIIERFYLDDQHHPALDTKPPRPHLTRLAVLQILLALDTLHRHLPVPLAYGFKHYWRLGVYRARGATFVPWP